MTHIVAIGECMVELTRHGADTLKRGFSGDTCNTAVYLACAGGRLRGQVPHGGR
jgi:sugar/nucleoside kinase (ribokinase family)